MILGIESTAHTFGIGVVDKGKILSNIRNMYTTKSGGIIPIESAKHHKEIAERVFEQALDDAKITKKQITAIAFSNAPGLAPCLLEGMRFAKYKAKELSVPLIPINHCVAHLEIGKITGARDPVLLYASGANTQIIAYEAGKYRIFGETLDIGVGNFIDNFARFLGIGFPGGPKVQELANPQNSLNFGNSKNSESSLSERKYIELPYSIKGMDVAFSGILTKLKQMHQSKKYSDSDLCFSLQETVFSMLVEASERALAHTGKKELLLGGGVACNSRLQEMCKIMCEERGCKFFVPERSLLVDNPAMIAFTGEIMWKAGIFTDIKDFDKLDINPKERTDDVKVIWK